MKQLLEQYVAAVIAGILALLLLFMIRQNIYGQGIGISQVLGLIVQDSIHAQSIVENQDLENYMKDAVLEMEVKQCYVTVNQEIAGSDCFLVKNQENVYQPVYWQAAWNCAWEPEEVSIASDGRKILFSQPGVYWVQIFSIDNNEKVHSWVAKLLVNER